MTWEIAIGKCPACGAQQIEIEQEVVCPCCLKRERDVAKVPPVPSNDQMAIMLYANGNEP